MKKFTFYLFSFVFLIFVFSCTTKKEIIKLKKYHKGVRYDRNSWIYLHVEGEPYERGFQYGHLIADEYRKAFECYNAMALETMGIDMAFIIKEAIKIQKDKIPEEFLEEMKGIAAGISAKGYLTTLDEIIGWNAFIEIAEGWWGQVKSNYASYVPMPVGHRRERCSAFVATGNATKDNKVVIAHSTFDDFWNAQWCNVILDIKPKKGHKILMQTTPGYIASMTDFFIMDSGLVGLETSFAGFNGFNVKGVPSYVRARNAMQYANNIDEFVDLLNKNNNGGNPASWLLADINTNEIAQFEQGLKFQNFQKKKNGCFFGVNCANDPLIRNLECSSEGYNDIRRHTGGRRLRFKQLLGKYYGEIDLEVAKKIMTDHYDVYHLKNHPRANTICAHYDVDPRRSMSSTSATHPNPYTPAGAVDCIITTTDMIKEMKIIARFGRPCGIPFDADIFFKKHPQWNWQRKYLLNRTGQDWTIFKSWTMLLNK